ncbi:MAG: O-antigen ligase family protein [Bryobacteraceae bacterium]|nr:O-antigen ligase family protein [Bryobacteraceae bacterium]
MSGIWPERGFCGIVLLLSLAKVQRGWIPQISDALLALTPGLWSSIQLFAGGSAQPSATLDATILQLSLGLYFLIAREHLNAASLRLLYWFGAGLITLSALQGIHTPGKVLWIWPASYPDVYGPFTNRNHFAAFAVLLLPVALLSPAARPRWAAVPAAGLLYGAVIASASRAGVLLATAELILIAGALAIRSNSRRYGAAAVVAGCVGCLAVGPGTVLARLSQPDPLSVRADLWASTWDLIQSKPWWGWGSGTFEFVYPQFARFSTDFYVTHAHNDLLEWTAEGGLTAVAILVGLAYRWMPAVLAAPWAWGVAAVLLHSLVDFPLARLGILSWILLITAAAQLKAESSQRSSSMKHRSILALPAVILLGCSLRAETGPLGTASSAGLFQVDRTPAMRTAALADGTLVETAVSPVQIQTRLGNRYEIGQKSLATVYTDRLRIEQGAGRTQGSVMELGGLRIHPRGKSGLATAALANGRVLVAASGSGVEVRTPHGSLIAWLPAGESREFQTGGDPVTMRVSGCLGAQNGRFSLQDEASNLTLELRGTGLDREVGNRVEAGGAATTSLAPAPDAVQVLEVRTLRRLSRGCGSGKAAATAAAGGKAGIAGTTVAIIGGVAIAALTGGMVAAGSFSSEEPPRVPISR